MAINVRRQGRQQPATEVTSVWKDRIEQGKRSRRRYHEQWQLNAARARGKFWLEFPEIGRIGERTLRFPGDLKAQIKRGLRLYTADLLTQYISAGVAIVGEGGEYRPPVAFNDDDLPSEDFADQANDALAFAWESEVEADRAIDDLLLKLMIFGTVAARVRFDPTVGPVYMEQAVWLNGKPLLKQEDAYTAMAAYQAGEGPRPEIKPLRGKITLEPLTPWQLLVPPGISHEDRFPWEIVVRPHLVSSIVAQYPHADGLDPQSLSTTELRGVSSAADHQAPVADNENQEGDPGKLEDHALVHTCYERPCPDYPNGRVVVLAGEEYLFLEERPELPYRAPSGGDYRSGVTYCHCWRSDVFWSRGIVDVAGPLVKNYARIRTAQTEIVRRGLPWVWAEEGTLPGNKMPSGAPMELVTTAPGRRPPQQIQGIGPGSWMQAELETIERELAQATGIQDVLRGENPPNVQTFSQLAQLREDAIKLWQPVIERFRQGTARITEDILHDVRRYWPPEKQIMIAGEDGTVKAARFTASMLPEAFYVRAATGTVIPRTASSEIARINELVQYGLTIGVPFSLTWLAESLAAQKPQALPPQPMDAHEHKARWENELLEQGQPLPPAQMYDEDGIHDLEHTQVLINAEITGRPDVWQNTMAHVASHRQNAMRKLQAELEAQAQLQHQLNPQPEPDQDAAGQGSSQGGPAPPSRGRPSPSAS